MGMTRQSHHGRVLVTGATGFVGGHVARRCLEMGREVHVIVRPSSSQEQLRALRGALHLHVYDGGEREMVRIVEASRPDTVFHLAARVQDEHEASEVLELIQSNIVFGVQLFEAVARWEKAVLVNAGTFWQHRDGTAAYHPVSLYAATKQALQDILVYYVEAFGLKALTLLLSGTYGPGDSRGKILNYIMEHARTGMVLDLSPGDQLLNLLHVSDVVEAFLVAETLLHAEGSALSGQVYSVHPEKMVNLRELVSIVEQSTGQRVKANWGSRPYRKREVMIPFTGTVLPHWAPKVSLSEGIRATYS